ncbi:neurotransmitter-gated ion-channel ligand binding domain-containing protein [Phthorimaea operculella]|nr:neurotransmitter-gated ion-channel ligand binding domain-containing protein [Phthorimaea operculella]
MVSAPKLSALVCLCLLAATVQVRSDDDTCPADRKQSLHDEGKLHYHLTCNYNSNYRPVKDHKTSVQVKVRFALKYLSFDSLEETFTVHSWVAMTWKDEFLTWTPSDYNNIEEIQVESHEIWSPRMALFNADASLYQSDSMYTTCLVSYDGVVKCVPHITHSGICRTTLRRWPYDSQNCTLYFGSWMHTGEQVNFTFYNKDPVMYEQYQDGPGWKLLKVNNERLPGKYKCCPNATYPMLKYTFQMQREAAGPAAIVVVPSVLIVILTLTSLLLDVKNNVRLMLICFSFFGHYTFLSEIGYDIPKHGSETPIILMFVRDSMIITMVAILETLFLMSIMKRTVPAPNWVVRVTRLATSGPGKYVVFTEFDPTDAADKKNLTEDPTSSFTEDRARLESDWIQFANLLNSCLFIISCLVYLVLIFVYIPYD